MAREVSSPGTGSRGSGAGQRQPQQDDRLDVPQAPLALYRRYRPASFAEVKGQDHVTEPLRQALRSGRVHHAYLFSGPRGCGKTSSARILARSLNCELGPTPDPCGKCASCVALGPSGPGSIDVIEIDAASHGGIDDARDLRERAFYSPVSARYKIYIIDEAHMVTGAGFNALLKLVEEPPPHLKFVFATTEPEKVIPTIRSRTHHYPFRLVPPAILRELLEEILAAEGLAYEPAVLPVVIRAGAGSVRDALSVLEQLIAGADESGLRYDKAIALLGYTDDALLDEMAEALAGGDGAAVFLAIDRVVEAGHDPRRFAMDLLDRLRDLIVLAAVPDAARSGLLDVPEDQLERMRKQAAGFGQERLARAAETISAGLVEMRGATSPRLLLELMCAQVLLPAGQHSQEPGQGPDEPARSVDVDLAARVERLERQLAAGARPPATADARRPSASTPERVPAEPAHRLSDGQEQGDRSPTGAAPAAAVDADTLRSRWPDILAAVREVRKTAWILLSNYASVDAVEGNVLTMAFDGEGNAKGFANSGSDGYLAEVLQAMFGVRLVIRAIVQPAHARGGSPPASSHGDQGDQGVAPGEGEHQGNPATRARAAGGSGQAAVSQEGAGTEGVRASRPAGAGQAGGDHATPAAADQEPARPTSAGRRSGGSQARRSDARSRVQHTRSAGPGLPGDPRSQTDAMPADAADDLTGTDLIMRELGGRVIDEITEV